MVVSLGSLLLVPRWIFSLLLDRLRRRCLLLHKILLGGSIRPSR